MKKNDFTYTDLANLQYSSRKEVFINNETGTYSYTTSCNYNTRKYHGEFVVPIPQLNNELYVLLSSLDISIVEFGQEFNLGIHKYNNGYYAPHGHKYLKSFTLNNGYPSWSYRVGGNNIVINKVLRRRKSQLIIGIKLESSENSKIDLRLRPLLSFRNVHQLTKTNFIANTKMQRVKNGICAKMYDEFPELFLQTSSNSEFTPSPLWYKDIEYYLEELRGYDYKEDLFVPGYIETTLNQGDTIFFSVSLSETQPKSLNKEYEKIIEKSTHIKRSKDALKLAAKQFFYKNTDKNTEMIAGYPWYSTIPRDIFIANPTLLLANNQHKVYLDIVASYLNNLELETTEIWQSKQISADAPLWLFWSLYQYKQARKTTKLWKQFGTELKTILNAYKNNELKHITYRDNGLLYITQEHLPLTWMNSVIDGKAIINRHGFIIEVCALWYNAISVALELAQETKDKDFIREWTPIAQKVKQNFTPTFTDKNHDYLADYATDSYKNFDVRPNQLIAVALPYSPTDKDTTSKVVQITEEELLTDKGIRTLSPKNKEYKKNYYGNHNERELQMHQGAVYPWLLSFYCRVQDTIYPHSSLPICNEIYENLEKELTEHGVGTLGEIFTADPPYRPIGAFSMAKSVASMLDIANFIKQLKEEKKNNKTIKKMKS